MKKTNNKIFFALIFLFLASCSAPKVTFYVTSPSELPVKDVENIEIGAFENEIGKVIPVPQTAEDDEQDYQPLTPTVAKLESNGQSATLVRGLLVSKISASGQYQLLNTDEGINLTGVLPDQSKTGVLSAKVRYFEHSTKGSEILSYVLVATKGNLPMMDQLLLAGMSGATIMALEANGKGYKVATPYIEKIAAMEVVFSLKRKSDGSDIVPPQTLRSYYLKKKGGEQDGITSLGTSHATEAIKRPIIENYPADESMLDSLSGQFEATQLALEDPDEFLARGLNLKQHGDVTATSLDIRYRLAKSIVADYVKKISSYQQELDLEVASGDAIAVNLINGNAYDKAINYLEKMSTREEADNYNLALAYESVGDRFQASKYYQEALTQSPGNEDYESALKRVQ